MSYQNSTLFVPNFYHNDEMTRLLTDRFRGFSYLQKLVQFFAKLLLFPFSNLNLFTLSKNWVVNNLKSTQTRTQLIIVAEIRHNLVESLQHVLSNQTKFMKAIDKALNPTSKEISVPIISSANSTRNVICKNGNRKKENCTNSIRKSNIAPYCITPKPPYGNAYAFAH